MTAVKTIRPLDPNALSASPEEAARFLSVHRRTVDVDRLIANRVLKARKAGRRVLVDMASIHAYYKIAASDRGRAIKDIEAVASAKPRRENACPPAPRPGLDRSG